MARNQKMKNQLSKIVPPDVVMEHDSHGRVVLGMLLNIFIHLLSLSTLDNNVCNIFFYSSFPISWNDNGFIWQKTRRVSRV